jgi:hypothetical protein
MLGSQLAKLAALLGERAPAIGKSALDLGSKAGAHGIDVAGDLGRMGATGGKWFGGRHPKTAAAAGGGLSALALEEMFGDDGEEELLARLASREGY